MGINIKTSPADADGKAQQQDVEMGMAEQQPDVKPARGLVRTASRLLHIGSKTKLPELAQEPDAMDLQQEGEPMVSSRDSSAGARPAAQVRCG